MLEFSDGEKFDATGELRVVQRRDGWYVVGANVIIPVDSREEGEQIIADIKAENEQEK